jgi:uncharacterized protein
MRAAIVCTMILVVIGCATPRDYRDAESAAANDDYHRAHALWHNLAVRGHADSQYRLGELYHDGLGVESDVETAIEWYTLAAEQGHVDAQNNLGIIYDEGAAIESDYRTAIKWYTLAAEQGDPGAQFNLGAIYLEEPTVEDPLRAYMWWGISAYLGNDLAGSQLEYAAEKLTEAEVAEARAMAHQCVRRKFRQC